MFVFFRPMITGFQPSGNFSMTSISFVDLFHTNATLFLVVSLLWFLPLYRMKNSRLKKLHMHQRPPQGFVGGYMPL
jgi:hypothetical protein